MTDIFDQVRDGDLSEFRPQETNANLHTPRGEGMLETSMHDVGFVAPITVAADGEAFDGSSRLEKVATVFKDVKPLVIEHDGTRPIVMKRIDIPTAKDPKAVKASVYANRVAEVSLEWDTDILEAWNDDGVLSIDEMWFPEEMAGLAEGSGGEDTVTGLGDSGIGYQNKYAIAIECEDEAHQEVVYNKLLGMGYKCKPLTL